MNTLKTFKETKDKMITTSEVLQSSFNNIFEKLKFEDFVLVENQRRKEVLIIQKLEKYLNRSDYIEIPEAIKFDGPILTKEQNLRLARELIKENVYYLMRFESSNITFPDIETIMAGSEYSDEFERDITINLINGWKYILGLANIDNIQLLKNIQSIIAKDQALELGVFRTSAVYITGTNYIPPLPSEVLINKLFSDFNKSNDVYQGAAELLVKLIKTQPFWDGNKRSSFLIVNKLLIERAKGIITIPENQFEEFNRLLNNYYNDEQALQSLTFFVVKNCIYNTRDKRLQV